MSAARPVVGISACLLGERVRFDGGHKKDDWIARELGKTVTWYAVCPEMEMGLGAPREAMRLERRGRGAPRLVVINTGEDLTTSGRTASTRILGRLPELDGFILKKGSPSCGVERVKVYGEGGGRPSRDGQGLFAEALAAERPLLPRIEEGRLTDAIQREHFVTRVFAHHRFRGIPARVSAVQKFHQEYKLLVMAHSPDHYQRLGRIAANSAKLAPSVVREKYGALFHEALAVPSTPGRRANVLQHMVGYFRGKLEDGERAALRDAIEEFRSGELSFLAALTVIRHVVKRVGEPYLEGQIYFDPYPRALALRKYL